MLPHLLALASFCMLLDLAASAACVGTISSLKDVTAAVKCTTVNIQAFTVPAGKTFSLNLLQGTIVNVQGDIQFGNLSWKGPLFQVQGKEITFNGNNKTWNGGGSFHWDGFGTDNGTTKPHPMMSIMMSGTLFDVHVVNSPAQAISLNNAGPLIVSSVIVDNSQGNAPNAKSKGHPAGHNTDGFDVSGDGVYIEKSMVINQDNCLAINSGRHIVFRNNHCIQGSGISIGPIASNVVVKDVVIQGNIIVNSAQAFSIKTNKTAKNSTISDVVFSDNIATNCTQYGVLVTQSYPTIIGKPGTGVVISDIDFYSGTTTVAVSNKAKRVAVNCAKGCCNGTWDWSWLKTSGGKAGPVTNVAIIGYTQ